MEIIYFLRMLRDMTWRERWAQIKKTARWGWGSPDGDP